jgi:hypothetical protein
VRLRLWTVALDMWRDAPVFGIGEGSFAWRFEDYAPPGTTRHTPVHGDAHNTWLQVLATRGLCGVAAFLLLIWAVGRALYRSWRRGDADRGLVIGVSLSLIGFLVYSTVQGMFYLQSIQILFWLLEAAASLLADTQESSARRQLPRALAAAALAAAAVVQGVVAWPLFRQAADIIARQPPGAYAVESDPAEARRWRWTTGDATLCLVPLGPRMQLGLATGDARLDEYPRTIRLSLNDRIVDTVTVAGPERISREVTLPGPAAAGSSSTFGECTGQSGEVRLTVTVDRRWSPLAAGLGGDPRTFGVQVFEPEYLKNP